MAAIQATEYPEHVQQLVRALYERGGESTPEHPDAKADTPTLSACERDAHALGLVEFPRRLVFDGRTRKASERAALKDGTPVFGDPGRFVIDRIRLTPKGAEVAVLTAPAHSAATPGEPPSDLITTAVALQRFHTSRSTLMRRMKSGDLKTYRKGTAKTATHIFSESELGRSHQRQN